MSLLSIIVPVYNEEAELSRLVPKFMSVSFPVPCEWIFVDDKSSDHSLAALEELSKQYSFRVIPLEANQGKGAAVIRGIQEAKGDLVIVQDADSEYNPQEIANVIQPILDDKADVVYGSRFKPGSSQVHRTYHYFVNRVLTILSNLCSGVYLTDMETCYKAFRSDLLKTMNLTSHRFGIEVELTAYAAKTRARIYEVPISYFPRTRLEGKKINWKDGVAAFYHLVRFNYVVNFQKAFKDLPQKYWPTGSSRVVTW